MSYTHSYPGRNASAPPESETLFIYGFEPASGSGYPVYLYGGGFGDKFESDIPETRMAYEMALRGHVAAIMEMPVIRGLLMCDGYVDSLLNASRRIFGYDGPGDMQETALAALCRRPQADCAAGIGLHGLSLGGTVVALAPRFAVGVTAELRFAIGVFTPGGHSCCGDFSQNMSCCDAQAVETGFHGGRMWPCLLDSETSRYLERSRRRMVVGRADPEYGDVHCDSGGDAADMDSQCVEHLDAPDTAYNSSRLASGYDCGEVNNCIQPDGSGYYLATKAEIGGEANNSMQSHNFHTMFGNFFEHPPRGYFINPNWIEATSGWGLAPNFDWLATTMRRANRHKANRRDARTSFK